MEVTKRNRKNDAITAFAIALLQLAYKMYCFFFLSRYFNLDLTQCGCEQQQ